MKSSFNRIIFYLFAILAVFGCNNEFMSEDFKTLSEKIREKETESPGPGSGACPIGVWKALACSGKYTILQFNSNGTGAFERPDCKGICTNLIFNFKYSISGSTATLTYTTTEVTYCTGYEPSRPEVPSGTYRGSFKCDGDQLTVDFGTGVQIYHR